MSTNRAYENWILRHVSTMIENGIVLFPYSIEGVTYGQFLRSCEGNYELHSGYVADFYITECEKQGVEDMTYEELGYVLYKDGTTDEEYYDDLEITYSEWIDGV